MYSSDRIALKLRFQITKKTFEQRDRSQNIHVQVYLNMSCTLGRTWPNIRGVNCHSGRVFEKRHDMARDGTKWHWLKRSDTIWKVLWKDRGGSFSLRKQRVDCHGQKQGPGSKTTLRSNAKALSARKFKEGSIDLHLDRAKMYVSKTLVAVKTLTTCI